MIEVGDLVRFKNLVIRPGASHSRRRKRDGHWFRGKQRVMRVVATKEYFDWRDDAWKRLAECEFVANKWDLEDRQWFDTWELKLVRKDRGWQKRMEKRHRRRFQYYAIEAANDTIGSD